jgi:DNA-binding MarR family transcriptional regulator
MTGTSETSRTPEVAAAELRELLCFNFYLGWRAIQAFYRASFEAGMNPQRMYTLAICDQRRPTTMTQIAAALQIELPAVLALVARMEDDGLLVTRRSAMDRRTIEVRLTLAGTKSRDRHDSLLRAADERLVGKHVRPQDIDALRRVVQGIVKSLEIRDTE